MWAEIEDLDINPATRGRNWAGTYGTRGTADRMDLDPIVYAAKNFVTSFGMGCRWQFEPGDGTPEAAEAARFARHVWLERYPFEMLVREAMEALYGSFGFHELTEVETGVSQTQFPLHPGRGRAVFLRKLYRIPARVVSEIRKHSRDGSAIGTVVEELESGEVKIDADRLVYWGFNVEPPMFRANPPKRRQYAPFFVKRFSAEIWAARENRYGMPVPVVERPNSLAGGGFAIDPSAEQDIDKNLAEWESDPHSYLKLPFGYKLSLVQSKHDAGIERIEEKCNRDILIASGAGHLWLGQSSGAQVGSNALAQVQANESHVTLDRFPAAIEYAFNHGINFGWQDSPIQRVHRLNYGDAVACPRLKAFDTPSMSWQAILPRIFEAVDKTVVDPQSPALRQLVRLILRIPEDNPDIGQTAEFRDMTAEMIRGARS